MFYHAKIRSENIWGVDIGIDFIIQKNMANLLASINQKALPCNQILRRQISHHNKHSPIRNTDALRIEFIDGNHTIG